MLDFIEMACLPGLSRQERAHYLALAQYGSSTYPVIPEPDRDPDKLAMQQRAADYAEIRSGKRDAPRRDYRRRNGF